jgi:hypothetical protein
MGYLYSKPNLRYRKPILAYDGAAAPTDAAIDWNDPTSTDESPGDRQNIVNVKRCFFATSSQYLFTTRAFASEWYVLGTWLYPDVLAVRQQWSKPGSDVRECFTSFYEIISRFFI